MELSTCPRNSWLTPVRSNDGKTLSLMDRLYGRLDGMYPNKWRAAFPSVDAVQNWRDAWAAAFDGEGMTPDEIAIGLSACLRLYDWPPSLPEFIKACRPPLDYEATHREAVRQMHARKGGNDKWSSAAVYWAAVQVGEFDLANLPYAQIKARWQNTLDRAVQEVRDGKRPGEVPARLIAIAAPGKSTTPPEVARKRIAEAIAKIINKALKGKDDNEPEHANP